MAKVYHVYKLQGNVLDFNKMLEDRITIQYICPGVSLLVKQLLNKEEIKIKDMIIYGKHFTIIEDEKKMLTDKQVKELHDKFINEMKHQFGIIKCNGLSEALYSHVYENGVLSGLGPHSCIFENGVLY